VPLVVAVLVLAGTNVLDDRVAHSRTLPVNLAVAALLLLLARWDGLAAVDVGLGRGSLGRGLRWGGTAAAVVLATYAVALLVPAGREAFLDRRAELGVADGLYQALVQVPFGTVLLEELAFRGVLLAMAARRWGTVPGVAFSSVLFGLWHVLPSTYTRRANPVVEHVFGTGPVALWAWVAVSVLATAAAGTLFCWLRLRSGSLLAPAGLHWATNGFGYLGALLARGLLAG
jgi:membrane protease YdiL (CAAX protease family)